jgi:nitric oxide synthase oxygenase domain/subunit
MTRNVTEFESPMEVLLREAVEFVQLYYHERTDEMQGTDGFLPCEERIRAIKESIYATGTYVHTFDELQHGARVAWRNAPKCANRKYWQQLKLLDQRKATSNKEMFDCCIEHLSKAVSDWK